MHTSEELEQANDGINLAKLIQNAVGATIEPPVDPNPENIRIELALIRETNLAYNS